MELAGARVVVTGGTGFLGTFVVRELQQAGAITVPVGRRLHDLRERAEIARMLRENHPDIVVHLAAVVGGIGANREEPGRFFYENAIMGLQLLEECRLQKTPKVLVVGTACSYPRVTDVPFSEDDLWDGYPEATNAPYGLAKRMLLVQAQAYREQYGMNTIFLVPVNLYGPGDNFDLATSHVIPGMIRKFVEARCAHAPRVTLWGDGSPTREFLHVADAARACRLALQRYDDGLPVNIGSGHEITIRELAGLIAEAVGFSGTIDWDVNQPNGQPRRLLDGSRARAALGFAAEVPFDQGIAETVAWYESSVAHPGSARNMVVT